MNAPVASGQGIHVVVLAAGRGSRLRAAGARVPKWLLDIGGQSIAERHLEGIAAAGPVVDRISVVTGHAAVAISRYLSPRPFGLDVREVFNPHYATLNNWFSVLRAFRASPADERWVLLNSDLMIEPEWLTGFLRCAADSEHDGLLAIDAARELTDESMKVALRVDGTVREIGKLGVSRPMGEYVGMLACRGGAFRAMVAALEGFEGEPGHAQQWYEGAVGISAAQGVPWHVWEMPSTSWVEIDDDRDLDAANALTAR